MVYNGNENYIFVSYAHADSEKVLPIVEALDNAGFRVWYDSGIEAGTEWPEYIEERLSNAQVVLVFMTPSAVESRNCRNEINFALELKKEMLVVYLEDTTLLKGMRLQLNSTQSMFRKHHHSEESFCQELLRAKIMQSCRIAPETPAEAPVSAPVAPKATPSAPPAPAKPNRKPLYIALGAVLVAAIVLICLLAFGGKGEKTTDSAGTKPDQETTQPSTEPTEPTAPAVVELSDNLMDLTVEIDGKVYQIPCKLQEFLDAGWAILEIGDATDNQIDGNTTTSCVLAKNSKLLYLALVNPSAEKKDARDCSVGLVLWSAEDGPAVKLAKGITATSTLEEILEAYGTPNEREDDYEKVTVTYYRADSSVAGENLENVVAVEFICYIDEADQKYNQVGIINTKDIKE